MQQLAGTLQQATGAIDDAIAQTAAGYEAVGTSIDDQYAQVGTVSGDQSAALTTLAARVQQQIDGATTLRTTLVDETTPRSPSGAPRGKTSRPIRSRATSRPRCRPVRSLYRLRTSPMT